MKIATWNVNSLRVRLPQVLTWLEKTQPDILALQETKLPDTDFPVSVLQEAGYHAIFSGQRTYNGVAFLIKQNAHYSTSEIVTDFPSLTDPQRRVLGMMFEDIRILNVYVPNGESTTSEKYQYKLHWLGALQQFLRNELKKHPKIIVLGDFNIAPTEIDVHDPTLWEGRVLFSGPERDAFHDVLTIGFHDCFRQFSPMEKKFSWWDYRLNAFKRNLGLRIDHILASTKLLPYCATCCIDKAPRQWERPSDHTPVVAEFLKIN